MTTTKNFERKQEFWISGKAGSPYTDIYLPIGDLEFYINGNQIICCQTKDVFLNDAPLHSEKFEVVKGDTLQFHGFFLTFYETRLELVGEIDSCKSKLPETQGESERFSGFPYYKRSPRIIYRINKEKFDIKPPPPKPSFTKGGIFQMLLPALTTVGFTLIMAQVLNRGPFIYMSIGMTVITVLFNIKKFFAELKTKKEETKLREKVYEDYLLKTRSKIRRSRSKEREALDYQNPTPKELEYMVLGDSSRLYEKTLLDDDFLQVNLGFYKGKSQIEVVYDKDDSLKLEKDELVESAKEVVKEYGEIDQIPVNVNLRQAHLGMVGSKNNIHEQIKYLLQQLTFFRSYHDLQVVFLHNEHYRSDFAYAKWYPHLKIQALNVSGEICNEQARDQILGSIQQILKDRKQKLDEEKQETVFAPHLLFIIDEPKLILNHAIMEYLQEKDKNLGFSIIYTTDQQANLPENIQTICLLENATDGRLLLNEGVRVNRSFQNVSMDGIDLEGTARSLSAIIHEQGISSKIPEAIDFFEMYQIQHPHELGVKNRWATNQSHKSLAVPLGVRAQDDYVDLNLHEKAHGPHGLVAGTTGSGKSEIVQSYILSLAVNFHPHEVGFLLIDYKGGGMANLFEKLPHLLGTITNLDKAESMRAMASIKSELSRRQHIFGEQGVNHINGYNKLFKLGKVSEPLPHLFLISDEFAELKKEQPEFMSELVSAARIGRSLGIHLILATQKPSGVVDDQIWTNSKFKLCLKVQDVADSREMLKTPDAANITQPGRSYLQVGNNEIYELFQSAWSGAIYGGEQTEEEKEDDRVYMINELGQGELINQDLGGTVESNQIKATQLDVTVEHLAEVYEKEKAIPVKKPWLPSLACPMESPYTKDIKDSNSFERGDYTLGIGMIDIPEEQIQEEYQLDLVKNGHLLYMASSGYGKSMLLSNIILGLAMKNAVRHLNFYILDLGNSALIPLRGLPHVADYMGIDDEEKIDKFQKRISDEIAARKRLLASAMTQNFHVYNESQETPLKAIVIAVDNYDVVSELGDACVAFLQKVARDGAGVGIYLLVTLTRDTVMRGATKGNFKERIAGFNFVEGENNNFIGRSQVVLTEDKKGRALIKRDQVNIMQLYTPVPYENEISYNEKLQSVIKKIAEMSTEQRAKGIPTLPEVLHYDMLSNYPEYEHALTKLPVGIDTVDLEVKYLDLQQEPALIIGTRGMGRTNTLKNVLRHINEHRVYLFDGKKGDLIEYSSQENIQYAGNADAIATVMEKLKEEIQERVSSHENVGDSKLTLKAYGQSLEPVFILIDVVQELYEALDNDIEKIDVFADAVLCGMYVVVTADAKLRAKKEEFLSLLLESKQGLIVGNIKEQGVFSYTGIREENRKVDIGYYHNLGENKKLKLIEYQP